MLDIKFIRENADAVKKGAVDKRIACEVDRLIAVDQRRRELQIELKAFRGKVKESGQLVGLLRNPKSAGYKQAVSQGKSEAEIKAEGVPVGKDDTENVELRTAGHPDPGKSNSPELTGRGIDVRARPGHNPGLDL